MAIVISIVSYPFLPARVGGQRGIALFNKYFARHLELICVTTKANEPAAAEGYEVRNILSNSAFRYINPLYFFTLRDLIREKKASHILLEHPYYGWLGVLLKWFTGVKLVVHSHNLEALRWKTLGKWWWSLLWWYEKYTHRNADYNFFIHDQSRQYAIERFGLDPLKCLTVTYGIETDHLAAVGERIAAKKELRNRCNIADVEFILLFNAAFRYSPNLDALQKITDVIYPLLIKKQGFQFKIIICGTDIPAELGRKKQDGILFAGFVEDMGLFAMGSDIFLNPVTEGGGIKTKLVEALAYNLNVVSTTIGATGVDPDYCNGKLLLSPDHDWEAFVKLIVDASQIRADTPPVYFEQFYWGNAARRAADFIRP